MEVIESKTIAILAEKPSVAHDIARVLSANMRDKRYLQGNGYVVTWAIGHLVSLAQPHEITLEWRQWRFDHLPILPTRWPLVVYEKTKDQFEVVRKILTSSRVSRIVCATDAGREGELILRYIYEAAECRKPVSRLWISSLTPDAIRKGFDSLRPGSDYNRLEDAATGWGATRRGFQVSIAADYQKEALSERKSEKTQNHLNASSERCLSESYRISATIGSSVERVSK